MAQWLSERLPSALGVIPEPQDRVPHQGPHREPAASRSAHVSASVSHEFKNKKKTKKNPEMTHVTSLPRTFIIPS